MPSRSLGIWSAARLPRLAALEGQSAATAADLALHGQNLRGLVMLLSAEFQGFCRDLYGECSEAVIRAMPTWAQSVAHKQFATKLFLDKGNATLETLRGDFARFDFELGAVIAANPANPTRLSGLSRLNAWRNHAAHATAVAPPGGLLTLADVRAWLRSCDELAEELDVILDNRLLAASGTPPW